MSIGPAYGGGGGSGGGGSGGLTNAELRALPIEVETNQTLDVSVVGTPALPGGAAVEAKQDAGNASLASIDTKVLTDTQLRATALPVSLATSPLPTGAATGAKQDTGNASLSSIDAKVLTDAQIRATALPVSLTSQPLPTGAATELTLQAVATENTLNWAATSADTIAGNTADMLVELQTISAKPDPLTDTQLRASAVPVSLASQPLPTGAATESTVLTLATSVDVQDQTTALLGVLDDLLTNSNQDSATIRSNLSAWNNGDTGEVVMGVVSLADGGFSLDGQYAPVQFDVDGRVKVVSKLAAYAPVSGNITANGQTVSMACLNMGSVIIHCSGTFSAVNVAFEASLNSTNGTDGNWFFVEGKRTGANTVETTSGSLSAAPNYAWRINLAGCAYLRVRATAFTSGTQTWRFQPSAAFAESAPASQVTGTQPVSGSLTSAGTTTATPATPNASIVSSAASTNPNLVKASAGTVYGVVASNSGGTSAFLKLHNLATTPVAGTSAVAQLIPIPAGSAVSVNWGPLGMRFGTGIGFTITNLGTDADATAVAAAQVKVTLSYI